MAINGPVLASLTPAVSVKQLVEVVSAQSERERRSVVARIKARRGQGHPPPYYTSAKAAIREFHANGYPRAWLTGRAADMRRDSVSALGWRRGDLLRSAAGLDDYGVHFGRRVLAVETAPTLGLVCCGVRVTSRPDLVAREGGVLKLLRLELRDQPPSATLQQIAPVVLFTAAAQYGFAVTPGDIELVHVRSGQVFVAREVTRIMRIVQQNCTVIHRYW